METKTLLVCCLGLVLLLPAFLTVPASAETIFADGFESAEFNQWTTMYTQSGASLNVEPNVVHSGSYAAHAIVAEGANLTKAYARKDIDSGAIDPRYSVYARVYVRFETLPTWHEQMVLLKINGLNPSTHGVVSVGLESDVFTENYKWFAFIAGDDNHILSSVPIEAKRWYCIEAYAVIDGVFGGGIVWIDETEESLLIYDTMFLGRITSVDCGIAYSTQSSPVGLREIFFDDAAISDSYIGSMTANPTPPGGGNLPGNNENVTQALLYEYYRGYIVWKAIDQNGNTIYYLGGNQTQFFNSPSDIEAFIDNSLADPTVPTIGTNYSGMVIVLVLGAGLMVVFSNKKKMKET